jgi:hypothetical protein
MAGPDYVAQQQAKVASPSDTNIYNFDTATAGDSIYEGVNPSGPAPSAAGNPITPRLMAMTSDPNGMISATEDAIKQAQQGIAAGGEQQARYQVALDRQKRQATNVNTVLNGTAPDLVSARNLAVTTDNYNAIVSQDINDRAKTSLEREAIDRIHDDLVTNNPTEARITYQLMFGQGNAMKVWHDEATKNLLLAQRIGDYENEAKNEGWGQSILNLMTSFIPTNYNFSRAGVVPGAEGGFKNWLLSGSGLQSQGETMWNKYRSPEEFADALKPGGELDASIRSNATTLGSYDPGTAADLLKNLSYESSSDKIWSNLWGVADPATVMPWGKIASVPKALTRLGSRSAARNAVADGVEQIVARGPEGAAASGISEAEATSHLETSAMNPSASNDAYVPLGVDVDTRLKAARQVLNEMPAILQTSRATTPAEVATAFEARAKTIEAEIGRPVKDIQYLTEDVTSGVKTPWKVGDQLPEQGNSILKARVTFGRKDGGGFASAKSAVSNAMSKMGLNVGVIEDTVTREIKEIDPEFSITAYHGTADAFEKFDTNFGGKLTDAKSAKMAIFATNNPDVAWTYAVQAAKDRAVALPEMKAAAERFRNASVEAAGDASHPEYKAARANYEQIKADTSVSGQNIRPLKIRMRNPYIVDQTDSLSRGYEEGMFGEAIAHAKANGHDGVIFRGVDDAMGAHPDIANVYHDDARMEAFKSHEVYAVFDPENIVSPQDAVLLKRDVSGQFFAQADFNVPLDGFTTTPMNTPDNGFFRFARSFARRLDRDAQAKAVASGASATQLETTLKKTLKDSLKGIGARDHGVLDEIVRAGQNKSMWFEDSDFHTLWERSTGEPVAPEKVINAYRTYQTVNDIDFLLRRDELYKLDANAGRENVKFDLGKTGQKIDASAKVEVPDAVPNERVFNASDNTHYNSRNPLDADEWERLKGEGHMLVTMKEPLAFPDGTRLRQVLIKRSELERGPLELEKGLQYKAGGHRAYTGKYYIKQAATGVQPDTGSEYMMNPNVFRTGNNRNTLGAWAERFNRGIDDYNRGIRDPVHFEDNVFANLEGLGFPTGDEFLKGLEEGRIAKNHHVEVVGDRELPKAYHDTRDDMNRFLDEAESGTGGYFRTTGRMYTSSKGDALLDETGEFAATVDPWETTDRAISNITRMTSFSNYKNNVLERFKSTYAKKLQLANLETASPMEMMTAKVRDHVEPALKRQVLAEQRGFAAIMNHETSFEKAVRANTRELAEWVLGDAKGGAREMGHDFVYWLSKNNPVNFLRGLAFDAKLGMFNIGQLFLQSTTTLASTALSPRHGFKGMLGAVPMFAFVQSKGSEAVLDVLAKRGVWKTAGFADEAEFKDFARFGYKTGFFDVNKTHLSINDLRPSRYFGATNALDSVREMGRAFFYQAEVINRSVAGRIAWEELKERGIRPGSAAFREQFMGIADDYSLNMMGESAGAFQKGLASIPTQFWGYNVRMMDAMLGSRFTPAQRTRLVLSQLALYGAGGVPVLDAVNDYYRMKTGASAQAGSLEGLIDRGALDNAIWAISGADVRVGERVGSGAFFTDTAKNTGIASAVNNVTHNTWLGDIFNVSEFNKLTPLEVAGGATWSISGGIAKTLHDVVAYSAAEGGPTGPITRDNLLKVADNVSTFSNFHKAYLANNYGLYMSQKGTVSGSNLPKEDAMWFALGLGRPQQADTSEFQNAAVNQRETMIKEAATIVRNWRQEAFNRPDVMKENQEKVNTLMAMYPPDVRQQIIRRTNKITDSSFYDYVQKKYDKEMGEGMKEGGDN